MLYYILMYFYVFGMGIIIGSFLNVCIYRLPKEESIIKGASHCTKCGTKIKKYDLIPVLSWIILRGKCRNCHDKISARYPIVELLNGMLWVFVFLVSGFCIKAIFLCLLFSALVVIFLMDWDTQLISTQVVLFIAFLGILNCIFARNMSVWDYIIGAFAVSIPLLLIYLFSRGQAMGLGDVYLMAAGGLFVGVKSVTVAIFFGLILGSIGGLIIKHFTKSSRFAFGPFLSIGIAVSSLYGNMLFDMYINFITR